LPIRFNHVAIAANDKQQSAAFLAHLLGLPGPTTWGPFVSVTLDDGVRLDYAEPGIEFPGQHYALLVSDDLQRRTVARRHVVLDHVPPHLPDVARDNRTRR
jgi:catechol 2,3-dioxygenase-like lactoylglutathione lyase family enzyme